MADLLAHYKALPLADQGKEFDRRLGVFRRRTVEEFVELGLMLDHTRRTREHGAWKEWLKDRGIARSTAYRWMDAAEKATKLPNLGTLEGLTLTGLLTAGSAPPREDPVADAKYRVERRLAALNEKLEEAKQVGLELARIREESSLEEWRDFMEECGLSEGAADRWIAVGSGARSVRFFWDFMEFLAGEPPEA